MADPMTIADGHEPTYLPRPENLHAPRDRLMEACATAAIADMNIIWHADRPMEACTTR